MKTLRRVALVAALFCCFLPGCDFNQNGSATIADCMKLPDAQQRPCIEAVGQANQKKLEAAAFQ